MPDPAKVTNARATLKAQRPQAIAEERALRTADAGTSYTGIAGPAGPVGSAGAAGGTGPTGPTGVKGP